MTIAKRRDNMPHVSFLKESEHHRTQLQRDEDDWDPSGGTEGLKLQEIQSRIEEIKQERVRKGITPQLSGRTIIVLHTLPYTCTLFKAGEARPQDYLELRSGDNVTKPQGIHSPFVEDSSFIKTPEEEDFNSRLPPMPDEPFRWVLQPRRGHAALNSGIRSLADGDITLVAWPGDTKDAFGDHLDFYQLTDEQKAGLESGLSALGNRGGSEHTRLECVPVWLTDRMSSDFYDGYCKKFLWPILHYFEFSDQYDKADEMRYWKAYCDCNLAFAKRVAQTYRPGDMVWVHDYHLLLVPRMLRDLVGHDIPIGLFLHSPFPSSEFFRCLPRRETLLEGMLGSTLCCFQTYSYGRHFLSSCVRVLGYEASQEGGVDARGNITHIAHCPIGIDVERVEKDRTAPGVDPKIKALRKLYEGKKIIVGRDKLDRTKGVIPKLQAFEYLLANYPHWRGRVVMIQVTSPSPNDSPQLGRKVSELVDHINGTYGSLHFQPLHHYHQTIERDEYFALLSAADLALITPTRDGMNTTSMEYTVCQTDSKNPLILSEFTGVTGSMKAALKVNPWDRNGCARAIQYCLNMAEEEKTARHMHLLKRVRTQTAAVWAHTLLLKLLESTEAEHATPNSPVLDGDKVVRKFYDAPRRLFMFDYDGTLTPIVKEPSAAVPSKRLLTALEVLAKDPKNIVYIISGRDRAFLDMHLGHIEQIGLSAEHGCFLREPGETQWIDLTKDLDMGWKNDVEEIFHYYEDRTTGSFVEKKAAALTFHYRNADPVYGLFQAKECQAMLESMQASLPINVLAGKKNVEVRPAHTDKGEIVRRLLYQYHDAPFILCAGDDRTDEDMFRAIFAVWNSAQVGCKPVIAPPPSLSLFPSLAQKVVESADDSSTNQPNGVSEKELLNTTILNNHSLPNGKPHEGNGIVEEEDDDEGSVSLPSSPGEVLEAVESDLDGEAMFPVVVDPNPLRKTVAQWHLDQPQDLIDLLARLTQQDH